VTASVKRQLQAQFAGDEFTAEGDLTDQALALRLQAMAASNGAAFDRASRNRFLQEAARRLRERNEEDK
jgi:hypothetical protein